MSSAALKSGFLLAVNVFIVHQQEKKKNSENDLCRYCNICGVDLIIVEY